MKKDKKQHWYSGILSKEVIFSGLFLPILVCVIIGVPTFSYTSGKMEDDIDSLKEMIEDNNENFEEIKDSIVNINEKITELECKMDVIEDTVSKLDDTY